MYISEQFYAETNRALKRKVRKAKKEKAENMTLPTDFLEAVSTCIDDLWFKYKHPVTRRWEEQTDAKD